MTHLVIEVANLTSLREAFAKAPERMKAGMERALAYSALLVQRVEKQEAPIDTGLLRGSIEVRNISGGVVIWPRAKYAVNVHEGTGLYGPRHQRIYPKNGKVLAWKTGGQSHFARSIAGQKPNPFATRTVDKTKGQVQDAFSAAVDNVLRG